MEAVARRQAECKTCDSPPNVSGEIGEKTDNVPPAAAGGCVFGLERPREPSRDVRQFLDNNAETSQYCWRLPVAELVDLSIGCCWGKLLKLSVFRT
jgi:hypothetical protein